MTRRRRNTEPDRLLGRGDAIAAIMRAFVDAYGERGRWFDLRISVLVKEDGLTLLEVGDLLSADEPPRRQS